MREDRDRIGYSYDKKKKKEKKKRKKKKKRRKKKRKKKRGGEGKGKKIGGQQDNREQRDICPRNRTGFTADEVSGIGAEYILKKSQ